MDCSLYVRQLAMLGAATSFVQSIGKSNAEMSVSMLFGAMAAANPAKFGVSVVAYIAYYLFQN